MDGDANYSNVGNQDGQVKDLGGDGEVEEEKVLKTPFWFRWWQNKKWEKVRIIFDCHQLSKLNSQSTAINEVIQMDEDKLILRLPEKVNPSSFLSSLILSISSCLHNLPHTKQWHAFPNTPIFDKELLSPSALHLRYFPHSLFRLFDFLFFISPPTSVKLDCTFIRESSVNP